MFKLLKVSPMFRGPDLVKRIGLCRQTEQEVLDNLLRPHLLETNKRLAASSDAPECIRSIAHRNVDRNSTLPLTVNEDHVVYINNECPEMDYFMVVDTTWYTLPVDALRGGGGYDENGIHR